MKFSLHHNTFHVSFVIEIFLVFRKKSTDLFTIHSYVYKCCDVHKFSHQHQEHRVRLGMGHRHW